MTDNASPLARLGAKKNWCFRSSCRCKQLGQMKAKRCGAVTILGTFRHWSPIPRRRGLRFVIFSLHMMTFTTCIQWDGHPLLLFSDPNMVHSCRTEKFQDQASHVDAKFQVVLLAQDSVLGRGRKGENRLWKRVTPVVTEFAWLPPAIAESFCSTAEEARTYHKFGIPHLGLEGLRFEAHMLIEDIFYLGDTRSADDLAVFTGMSPEQLCLGCGLGVEEPFTPLATSERPKLFAAAYKLLMFVLHDVSAQASNDEERALQLALKPLIENGDCRFVAAVTSLVQSLLEGRTDCPISGVFGAGKTLKIVIAAKENVAAHAFAKLLALEVAGVDQLPCWEARRIC